MLRSVVLGLCVAGMAHGVMAAPETDAQKATCLDFARYSVSSQAKPPFAPPKINQDRHTRKFRTVILDGAQGAPDFAGHLRVVEWGCGSGCQQFALVDRKTGDIHMVETTAMFGASHRVDSRLFIINPPEALPQELLEEEGLPEWMRAKSFVWDSRSRSLQPLPGCGAD